MSDDKRIKQVIVMRHDLSTCFPLGRQEHRGQANPKNQGCVDCARMFRFTN